MVMFSLPVVFVDILVIKNISVYVNLFSTVLYFAFSSAEVIDIASKKNGIDQIEHWAVAADEMPFQIFVQHQHKVVVFS